ncbi:hypothetical protein MPTK1_7g18840 [Marchantia polymorpha subsp. ruderalis]|uniref:Uncharacterized protein n=2 Tax=Marchantia polymorpha TaxID=3197 RepID=A0AAF6C180_MARPO|nr:hypothetical protein MARPO_0067s0093 [Marchantia polymorpha]BBN18014.1 hypothetical protein Mp_7g18840 [Marchantia polymorpha subsp. ruderalis]|eukprot:PTQ36021.1 hypothetical protein MARPO_0067s0093 [Marchantia polymorpha]
MVVALADGWMSAATLYAGKVGCSSFELQRSVRKDRSTGVAVNRRNYLDMPILWTREA